MSNEEKARAYGEALAKARAEYEKARKQGYTWLMDLLEGMFPDLKESEDEKIRKELIQFLRDYPTNLPKGKYSRYDFFDYLEKQKEYHSDDVLNCTYQEGFEDGFKAGREVERRNSSDNDFIKPRMQEPWNKEKQKEQRPVENPFDANETMKMKDRIDEGFTKMMMQEQKPILEVFGFKVGDAVRLKDGDGRKHIIKSFEEVKWLHGPNFYRVAFEDNSARDGIYPGEEYPNGYYTQMEKFEEEQKPLQTSEEKEYIRTLKSLISDFIRDKQPEDVAFYQKIYDWLEGRHVERKDYRKLYEDIAKSEWFKKSYVGKSLGGDDEQEEQKPVELNLPKDFKQAVGKVLDAARTSNLDVNIVAGNLLKIAQKSAEWDELQSEFRSINEAFEDGKKEVVDNPKKYGLCKPTEWSEEDIKKIRSEEYTKGFNDAAFGGKLKEWSAEDEDRIRQIERIAQQAGCTQKLQEEIHDWLKSIRRQVKAEWSEEDERMRDNIISILQKYITRTLPTRPNSCDVFYTHQTEIDWLKSLRPDSYKNCNSRWKPSEEQMEALERASTNEYLSAKQFDILVSLYEQLKSIQ